MVLYFHVGFTFSPSPTCCLLTFLYDNSHMVMVFSRPTHWVENSSIYLFNVEHQRYCILLVLHSFISFFSWHSCIKIPTYERYLVMIGLGNHHDLCIFYIQCKAKNPYIRLWLCPRQYMSKSDELLRWPIDKWMYVTLYIKCNAADTWTYWHYIVTELIVPLMLLHGQSDTYRRFRGLAVSQLSEFVGIPWLKYTS